MACSALMELRELRVGCHPRCGRLVRFGLEIARKHRRDRADLRMLLREGAKAIHVARALRGGKQVLEFRQPSGELVEHEA
jgi:hypothetical protein